MLQHLSIPTSEHKKHKQDAIANFEPLKLNQQLLLNVRHLSHTLYQFKQYSLPDKYQRDYLVPAFVQQVSPKNVTVTIPLLDHQLRISPYDIYRYTVVTPSSNATIVDESLLHQHPCIQTLSLPSNWDQMTDQDASDLLDSYSYDPPIDDSISN